jgi:chromosome segregation ATPase
VAEAAQLRKAADALHARHRSLTAECTHLRSSNLKAESRIKELALEVDGVSADLQQTTRKLANARAAGATVRFFQLLWALRTPVETSPDPFEFRLKIPV